MLIYVFTTNFCKMIIPSLPKVYWNFYLTARLYYFGVAAGCFLIKGRYLNNFSFIITNAS